MTAFTPSEVATTYILAVGRGDLESVRPLLSPNVRFTTAGATVHGPDGYLAALGRIKPVLARNEIRQTFVNQTDVCVLYDFLTDTPVGAIPTVEVLGVDDSGQIERIELIFEQARWPEVMEALASRGRSAQSG